jgi:hypothetical protein
LDAGIWINTDGTGALWTLIGTLPAITAQGSCVFLYDSSLFSSTYSSINSTLLVFTHRLTLYRSSTRGASFNSNPSIIYPGPLGYQFVPFPLNSTAQPPATPRGWSLIMTTSCPCTHTHTPHMPALLPLSSDGLRLSLPLSRAPSASVSQICDWSDHHTLEHAHTLRTRSYIQQTQHRPHLVIARPTSGTTDGPSTLPR